MLLRSADPSTFGTRAGRRAAPLTRHRPSLGTRTKRCHACGMVDLPRGTVSLLFTDIEGSTELQHRLHERYREVVTEHRRLLEEAIESNGGLVVDRQTESFFAVFPRMRDAVGAASAAQRAIAVQEWPEGAQVKVRMGIHAGEPELRGRPLRRPCGGSCGANRRHRARRSSNPVERRPRLALRRAPPCPPPRLVPTEGFRVAGAPVPARDRRSRRSLPSTARDSGAFAAPVDHAVGSSGPRCCPCRGNRGSPTRQFGWRWPVARACEQRWRDRPEDE